MRNASYYDKDLENRKTKMSESSKKNLTNSKDKANRLRYIRIDTQKHNKDNDAKGVLWHHYLFLQYAAIRRCDYLYTSILSIAI